MTVKELFSAVDLKIINVGDDTKNISGIYCCDLLSFVMGKSFEDCAWVTVMGNINSIAVSSLADMSCIILAEGVSLDEQALIKAREHNIAVLGSEKSIFDTALAVHTAINNG